MCSPLGGTVPPTVGCLSSLHSIFLVLLRELAFRSVPEAGRSQRPSGPVSEVQGVFSNRGLPSSSGSGGWESRD